MTSLNTVKGISILVFSFSSIHCWIRNLVLFAGFADLKGHPEVEETVDDKSKNYISIFFGEEFNSGHGFFPIWCFERKYEKREN